MGASLRFNPMSFVNATEGDRMESTEVKPRYLEKTRGRGRPLLMSIRSWAPPVRGVLGLASADILTPKNGRKGKYRILYQRLTNATRGRYNQQYIVKKGYIKTESEGRLSQSPPEGRKRLAQTLVFPSTLDQWGANPGHEKKRKVRTAVELESRRRE